MTPAALPFLSNTKQDSSKLCASAGGEETRSSHSGTIAIKDSIPESNVHIFPDFAVNLLSAGKLADEGCEILLQHDRALIMPAGACDVHILAQASRSYDGLYTMQLGAEQDQASDVGYAYLQYQHRIAFENHAELVRFFHATMSNCSTATLSRALHRGYIEFPLVTPKIFDDNIVEVVATTRGHMAGAPLRVPRTRSSKGAPKEAAAADSGASKGEEQTDQGDGGESDDDGLETTYLVDHSFRTSSDQTGNIQNAALLKSIM